MVEVKEAFETPVWESKYEIGIEELDLQHQNFLKLIKKVELAGKGYLRKITIEDILQEIILYAQFHFRNEENLMKEFDYPEFDKHKEEHINLADNLLREMSNLMVNPDDIEHLHRYLIKWLFDHIIDEDSKLTDYMCDIT